MTEHQPVFEVAQPLVQGSAERALIIGVLDDHERVLGPTDVIPAAGWRNRS
jgi:hypothetical protein